MIDHLSTITLSNWDKKMRELGAKALHNLTPLDLDYMINKVLPYLVYLLTFSSRTFVITLNLLSIYLKDSSSHIS